MADQFLKPPKPLEQSSKEAWDEWIEAFIWYEKAVQLEKKPQEVQVAIFMASIGQLAQKIYKTFKLNEGEENKLQELEGKFNEYFTPKLNYTVERYQFNNIKQCNEPFKEFLTKVKLQAKKCKFDQMEDELIKDRIVIGIQNNDVREKLLSDPDLNITKAIQICVAAENANTQLREIKDRNESEPSISTIERKISRDFSQKAFNPRDTTSFKKLINNCTRCGAKQ
ncbi:K02A2.6-like [Cordylochernes scorpioides]|uniref:K02A2.6-like n=1 Tax=Cordylochernes scorpioides TaxID=51811 RepID=A0ABY6K8V0_9ARAC|nr:K02A2.6-like [Cordylochernes scorpioides]UYV65239.1 K02A2.6-like [Cordylochernes scorpioides]